MPLGNKIRSAQSSTIHVTGYERLKEYTFIKIDYIIPFWIHDTKYNTISETIHHKDITIHHKDTITHHNTQRYNKRKCR